jgi:peptidyl-tRNA hydrolase ICT1
VNRVSSKATLKVALSDLQPIVPSILHAAIRESPYYARKTDVVVIQADDSRKQSDNMHACFVRLHRLIADAGANVIPGETSESQKNHVQKL